MNAMSASRGTVPAHLPLASALACEMAMLDAVAKQPGHYHHLVWECQRCIVVPRRLSMLDRFADACAPLRERGFPVFIRETGGDAVVQGPGIVNVSIAFAVPSTGPDRIRAAYARLCTPLVEILGRQGIEAAAGTVPGSMCDGAYNVVVGGCKLAGTAQRWRVLRSEDCEGGHAALAHLAVSVDADHAAACDAVNALYAGLGIAERVNAGCHINWLDLIPKADHAIRAAFLAELASAYRGLRTRPESRWQQAGILTHDH